MTTVEQALQTQLTVEDAIHQIQTACKLLNNASLNNLMWSADFIATLNKELISMNRLQERLKKEE